ncbi:BofC C-terminal domain-containing protein [Paenibacillus tarimensis]|uniref:BofC C-terminal domain-containing protein n=1 Tax=Paenibacillus tarimensis TaxID=416012 RepID=UPI001F2C6445|nr:BofC C-terminal domain-containing protein [Paenibacillus tarimensis]MCF2943990.1 BofC C-terminal domain-containing protein [Paenibacillus tarimensis]
MMGFSLWKQLKKRLRMRKRPTWHLAAVGGLVLVMGLGSVEPARAAGRHEADTEVTAADTANQFRAAEKQPSVIETLRRSKQPVPVSMKRIYLCGEESQDVGLRTSSQIIRMLQSNPGWTAVMDQEGTVVIEERVDDLSPACKESAVFGISKDDYLSLFEGPPSRNQVLRTFYQLDVRFMESSLPEEQVRALHEGIRVTDREEFNSVLSSFSEYALPVNRDQQDLTY